MKDLTNNTYGEWTVLERDPNKSSYWICKCSCGKISSVRSSALTGGKSKSCGHSINMKNLTNKKFGKLTPIKPTSERKQGSVVWECKCECGNTCKKTARELNLLKFPSCGCLSPYIKEDLTNKTYGLLTVLGRAKIQDKFGRCIWQCKCQCGSITNVSTSNLISGHTISCGCINSVGEYKIAKILYDNNIVFEKEKTFKNGKYLDTNKYFRFDFFLPEYNLIIEYDGKQHFKEWTSKTWTCSLEENKKRDKIKNNWCKENNIHLIRIPYTYLDSIKVKDLLLESNFLLF